MKQFKHKEIGDRVMLGWGTWDAWGFGISLRPSEFSFAIEFIHWYVWIEVWDKK